MVQYDPLDTLKPPHWVSHDSNRTGLGDATHLQRSGMTTPGHVCELVPPPARLTSLSGRSRAPGGAQRSGKSRTKFRLALNSVRSCASHAVRRAGSMRRPISSTIASSSRYGLLDRRMALLNTRSNSDSA